MNKIKFNTVDELEDWLRDADVIDSIEDEYDGSGNHWSEYVYEKDKKYYVVSFCNKNLSPIRPKKIDEPDTYEITEVKPIKKMVEITEWHFT